MKGRKWKSGRGGKKKREKEKRQFLMNYKAQGEVSGSLMVLENGTIYGGIGGLTTSIFLPSSSHFLPFPVTVSLFFHFHFLFTLFFTYPSFSFSSLFISILSFPFHALFFLFYSSLLPFYLLSPSPLLLSLSLPPSLSPPSLSFHLIHCHS